MSFKINIIQCPKIKTEFHNFTDHFIVQKFGLFFIYFEQRKEYQSIDKIKLYS